MNPIYVRRRRKDIVIRGMCVVAAAIGVTWLALILITLLYNGVAGLNLQIFTQNTPPPGSNEGGLLNAIVGSVIMTVLGVGVGAPLGLFAGTYLAEYGRNGLLANLIRFTADVLNGVPSIVMGIAAYGLIVVQGSGTIGKLDVDSPNFIRFGEITKDEVFVTAKRAAEGVTFKNTGSEPFVSLRYFGPDTHPDLPKVGDHRKVKK